MIVRPTPWGRGKSSWGPWNGLVGGIVGRVRMGNEINDFLLILVTVTDSGCVVGT